jgi:D-inositol-3-phosphate glycosyltransferase
VIERVAYLSIHTSPLADPGSGDAGGMNVYIHELARTMAGRGVEVDVFTRRTDPAVPGVVAAAPRYRVIHVDAGPGAPLPISALESHVGEYAEGVVRHVAMEGLAYDVVHSHYWLSAWAGALVGDVLSTPLAISFHTLGRVKDSLRRSDEPRQSLLRIAAETEVIGRAGCVVASTPAEATELIEHYSADPERLCVSPPGVDHDRFRPGSRNRARAALGLAPDGPLVLFMGRIQPLKGVDVAIEAFRILDVPEARMLVVGGPSGAQGAEEASRLSDAVVAGGLEDRIEFRSPVPHEETPILYQAADLLVVPSRSESFGLVAAAAQACGVPGVAARVGGLAYAVADGESGYLVGGWDPAGFADAMRRVLTDAGLAARLSAGAVEFAERFSWPATADRLLELYAGISGSETRERSA